MSVKIYLDYGLTPHTVFAGDPNRNLPLAETALSVRLVARDSWVQLDGSEVDIERAQRFFSELSTLHQLRGGNLEQADFEQVLKAYRDRRDGELRALFAERLRVSPKKREILPRTRMQLEYLNAMRTRDVVFGIGPAGTGKTYLAMAMAVSEFLKGNYSRIVLTRPAKEAGENLGFLPGNLEEKIMPYLRPLYDALFDMFGAESFARQQERGIIEVAPLAYMRGRTLDDSFIILDEAQNTTREQMKMFLTRLGSNSKAVITGDITQIDLADPKKSGLIDAMRVLERVEGIETIRFNERDVVRNRIVQEIIKAYAKFEKKGEK